MGSEIGISMDGNSRADSMAASLALGFFHNAWAHIIGSYRFDFALPLFIYLRVTHLTHLTNNLFTTTQSEGRHATYANSYFQPH